MQIEGSLDSPRHRDKCRGFVEVSGWCFSHAGEIQTVDVYLDDRKLGRASYGHTRPDVIAAFPELPNHACCFYERFDFDPAAANPGERTLVVRITDSAANTITFERSIRIPPSHLPRFKCATARMLESLGLDRVDLKVKDGLNQYAYWANFRLRLRNARFRRNGVPDGLPLPPARLVYLVSGRHDIETFYYQSGITGSKSIQKVLAKNGLDIRRFGSILDFGCGCGRVIRRWKELTDSEIHGSDYNPRMIDWCKRFLDFADFRRNDGASRLSYSHAAFDFIYAISVFTHLSEEMQDFWIKELTRVLKPGGYLYLTVHVRSRARALPPKQREAFDSGELVVLNRRLAGSNCCGAFHPEKYLRETLFRELRIVDFVPDGAEDAGQDAILLQRSGEI